MHFVGMSTLLILLSLGPGYQTIPHMPEYHTLSPDMASFH
jgi:hypothetical protein